ncbi:MAG: Asp-tRNA(Asn)/Glu-tRNA(Gln) amidotransferase subunit GatC [Ignavibacteria bacterium]|nr:Asp-tRNA(Asn)/Glu-tRNA(Gln) amidotransferase subunit GatC [Ignavibacteria bacterium]
MTSNDIARIAELARLQFSEEEIAAFTNEFIRIVDYVGTIASLNLEGVEPMTTVSGAVNVSREDVAGECLTSEEALSNAPRKNEAFFKVPKVLG